MSPTVIVSNIGKCWKLQGTNRKICEYNYNNIGSTKKKKGLIAFSDDDRNPSIQTPFEMNYCDPNSKDPKCDIKFNVSQPVKCDPKTQKCDPYYYRMN